MNTENKDTLIIEYISSKPKSKIYCRLLGKIPWKVIKSGDKLTFQLKPGEYKVKIRFGFLKVYKRWIIVSPTMEPIIVHCSREKDEKVVIEQSGYSGSIARLLDDKKKKDDNEQYNLAFRSFNLTGGKIISMLILLVIAWILMIPVLVTSIIDFVRIISLGID